MWKCNSLCSCLCILMKERDSLFVPMLKWKSPPFPLVPKRNNKMKDASPSCTAGWQNISYPHVEVEDKRVSSLREIEGLCRDFLPPRKKRGKEATFDHIWHLETRREGLLFIIPTSSIFRLFSHFYRKLRDLMTIVQQSLWSASSSQQELATKHSMKLLP